ncbi:hypothetical protein RSAG8_11641, partial [Rhizoctonia solani AG-8 WAC10335]
DELGLRTAILYCGNLSSNAFGGLLAAGILDGMQGKLGHAAWRWLFFIEGALTMAVATLAVFILPDFPNTTRWLSPEERRLAEVRMAEDVGGEVDKDSSEEGHLYGFFLAMKDWKVWWFAVALTGITVGLSFNAYFPLTATLGYSRNISLLLCAPPWAFATLVGFVNARHADKTGERFLHVSVPLFIGIIGFVIAIATMNIAARYISLFLMAQAYAGLIVLLSWVSNSIPRPPAKRAVALAFVNAFSQLGNVAGSYVWPKNWGPTYRKSYIICIACFGLAIVMAFFLRQHLVHLNKRLNRGEVVEGICERTATQEATGLEGVPIEELRTGRQTFRFLY